MEGFVEFIEHHQLCQREDKVLLGVSGGVDSMAMLHLFHEHGFNVGVAHCNFCLRGKDSDEDERLVKKYCADRSVPFFSKRFETKYHAREKGISIQMAARQLRYNWFEELLKSERYNCLATAHHLNDNVETVLLNLVRGTGLAGLAGIPLKTERVFRPLLQYSKKEILEYAKSNQIPWRADASNESDDYQRNLLRNQVIPILRQLNPNLEETFVRNMERLAGAKETLDVYVRELRKKYLSHKGAHLRISKKVFSDVPAPAFVLWQFTKEFGFSYEQMNVICAAIQRQPGAQFLSSSHRLVVDREHLMVESLGQSWTEVTIASDHLIARLGPWQLQFQLAEPGHISHDKNEATLDRGRIEFPLTWRKWRPGDAFVPLGMQQKKKLSDFLIDSKVSVPEKDQATVLESGGEIVWVVGHRIDDRFKVTDQTTEVIQFSLHSDF
ncbi:MAG: tRNA lysidine(34) synthetase TilS [Cyclobacteriaceae bacterium]